MDYATDPLVALVASIDRIELGISDNNQEDIYQEQFEKVKKYYKRSRQNKCIKRGKNSDIRTSRH